MKITPKTILTAAAFAGLLAGCATEAKKECKGSTCNKSTKCQKSSCSSKSMCKSKGNCSATGNCSAKKSN